MKTHDTPLFDWKPGDEYARHSDPDTSKDALEKVDLEHDRLVAMFWCEKLCEINGVGNFTRDEFIIFCMENGVTERRAQSLRRRLSDLVKLGRLEVIPALRREGQQVLRIA